MQRPGITRERLVGLCVLGILLLGPSVISIFDLGGKTTVWGVPVLLVYLFGAWFFLILIAAVLVIRRHFEAPEPLEVEED